MLDKLTPKPKKKLSGMTIPEMALLRARHGRRQASAPPVTPFVVPDCPPGVVPRGGPTLAMDDDISSSMSWAGAAFSSVAGAYGEGLVFLGYPYLAVLAQRPEYRRISETIATEMTRKWIRLQSASDEDKTDKIAELTDELDRLRVRDVFRLCAEQDGFFGKAHLYLDTGQTDDREELKTSIGTGRNRVSREKVKQNTLRRLTSVESMWCYPTTYNSTDPLSPDWYAPQSWHVNGKEIHGTRLLTFVGREVPDILKPAYLFGGLSMSQMAKPYVDNWLRTRQSVADLIHSFSVFVLRTNMAATLGEGGEEMFRRLDLFNLLRDNRGIMALDRDTEEFQNVSASLGTLDNLQAQTQEHMAAVAAIPIVKLLGIQPAGLNASSEGEIRTFYDWVHAFQEKLFRPNLTRVVDFAQLSLWGEVDKEITVEFEPLWSMDDKALAEKREIEARTAVVLIDAGVLAPAEERRRIAGDPDTPWQGLDAEDVPDLKQEEAEGLEPKGTTKGAGGGEGGGGGEEDGGFGGDVAGGFDAEFEEGKHPRDKGGEFTSGGGDKGVLTSGTELSDEEKFQLTEYLTSGEDLNPFLRRGGELDDLTRDMVSGIDAAIGKHTLPKSTVLYRGVSGDVGKKFEKLVPGQVISSLGYTSTTKTFERATEFGKVVMELQAPAGTNAFDMEHVYHHLNKSFVDLARGNMEVLLGRGTRLEFTGRGNEGQFVFRVGGGEEDAGVSPEDRQQR